MIYLLGQIVLCLALAALAGWFVGWSWRGFREHDRVEDLRRTLRATEEVKDRDLAESQRREEALRSRLEVLERRSERLADELSAARRDRDDGGGEPQEDEREEGAPSEGRPRARSESLRREPSADETAVSSDVHEAEVHGLRDRLERMEEALGDARARTRQAEEALDEKRAALAVLQAEISGLRATAEERSEQVTRLERRVVELEPLKEALRRRELEVRELERRLDEATRERREAEERLREARRRTVAERPETSEPEPRVHDLRHHLDEADDSAARLRRLEMELQRLRRDLAERDREPPEPLRYRPLEEEGPELEERLQQCARRLQQVEGQLEEVRLALRRSSRGRP